MVVLFKVIFRKNHVIFVSQNSKMYTIGITGGTASGKSTFVELLKQKCEGLSINFISQDDYYKDITGIPIEERSTINFDHPNALDFDLLSNHIKLLQEKKAIEKPLYSFEKHNRLPQTETIFPKEILVIEGILVLSTPQVKKHCNTTIFIDAPKAVRMERRIKRDIAERGRTRENVLLQFNTTISPMHTQFIEPVKDTVDYIVDGTKSFSSPLQKIYTLITNISTNNRV